MARFLPLNLRAGCLWAMAGLVGVAPLFPASLRANPPAAPATTPIPAAMTNAAPALVVPPDTLGKYGKILAPSDEMAHPLKLSMPFPGIGEVKVPNQDEMLMRDKLEALASLSDDQIRKQLGNWPAFSKMNLRDEGAMLQRIQDFRDHRSKIAQAKAKQMGLLTLLPAQEALFEKEYWDKRLQMDHDLAKQFDPIAKAREQKLDDELYREFSSANPIPTVQAPPQKPLTPAHVAQNKPSPPPVPPAPDKSNSPSPTPIGAQPSVQ